MVALEDRKLGRVDSCLRGGASVPGLLRCGGVAELDRAQTVPELLLGPAPTGSTEGEGGGGGGGGGLGRGWDFVVVNDFSQQACWPEERAASEAALERELAPLLARGCGSAGGLGSGHGGGNGGATVALYATPAYRRPVKGTEGLGDWAAFAAAQNEGYAAFAAALERGLAAAAAAAGLTPRVRVVVASANGAFAAVRAERPGLWHDLFADDDFHPSPAGSYLAACVLHVALFHRAPPGPPARECAVEALAPVGGDGGAGAGDFEEAQALFAGARRPLGEEQPSTRLPTAAEMAYLRGVASAALAPAGN